MASMSHCERFLPLIHAGDGCATKLFYCMPHLSETAAFLQDAIESTLPAKHQGLFQQKTTKPPGNKFHPIQSISV